jgi:hypothetical protein
MAETEISTKEILRRQKISSALKGHRVSTETRAKIGAKQRGKSDGPLKEETKQKISKALTGRVVPKEVGAKIASAKMKNIDGKMLYTLYINQQKTEEECASYLGCSVPTIHKYMMIHNIPIRSKSEAHKLLCAAGWRPKNIPRSGLENPIWKGGRLLTKDGYVICKAPGHPRARKGYPYVFEHILVWEKVHQRQVPKGWVIHHLNGIRNDNRPENLVAMPRGKHIDLAAPYKKRIRELEAKVELLTKALEQNQLIFHIGEN